MQDPKTSRRGPTRRRLLRALGGCLAALGMRTAPLTAASPEDSELEVDRLWDAGPESVIERAYRVDATILFFSAPVFRRNDVGDARVALRRLAAAHPAENRFALEFAAASDPKRAHGLDRMGWIREVVLEKDGAPQRAGVLGIMSDSPEQTAEEARTALDNDSNAERLVAIDASHSGNGTRTTRSRVIRFRAPRANYTGGEALPGIARESFRSNPVEWRTAQWPIASSVAESAPSTFLYALKRALEQGGARTTEYVWNQNRYTMRLERDADTRASHDFSARVDRVHGELRNVTQNLRPLSFQVYVDRDAAIPMPLRVEFQPRSFLRLTLEAVNVPLTSQLKEKA